MPLRARRRLPVLRVLAASALFAGASGANAQGDTEPLPVQSIDVYGTDAMSADAFREEFGSEIERFVALLEDARLGRNADEAALDALANELSGAITARLSALVPLAHLGFAATTDFGPPPRIHVMVDVVEEADKARRMPFGEAATGHFEDPGGLFALWDEFQQEVFTLAYAGADLEVEKCPVLHCIAPFELPVLEPYLERFNSGAREHEELLYTIAAQSGDASQRANALFLLAHTNTAERLVSALEHAIRDPAGNVRNNAMRVLLYLAKARPELDYPVEDLIAALDFPTSSDRNKAGYTLAALATQDRYRAAIRDGAVPIALRMLRLLQPNNHDPAYEILKLVSGENYGDRDYAAWESWGASAAAPETNEAVNCLSMGRVRDIEVVDDDRILFYEGGRRVYLNVLEKTCEGLKRGGTIAWGSGKGNGIRNTRLCASDAVSVVDRGRLGSACELGVFRLIPNDLAEEFLSR